MPEPWRRLHVPILTGLAANNSVLTIGQPSRNRPRLTPEGFVAHKKKIPDQVGDVKEDAEHLSLLQSLKHCGSVVDKAFFGSDGSNRLRILLDGLLAVANNAHTL